MAVQTEFLGMDCAGMVAVGDLFVVGGLEKFVVGYIVGCSGRGRGGKRVRCALEVN